MVSHSKVESTSILDIPEFVIYHLDDGTTVIPVTWVLELFLPKVNRTTRSNAITTFISKDACVDLDNETKSYISNNMDVYDKTRLIAQLRWVTVETFYMFLKDTEQSEKFTYSFDVNALIMHMNSYVPKKANNRVRLRVSIPAKRKREDEEVHEPIRDADYIVNELRDIITTDNRQAAIRLYMNSEDFQQEVARIIANQEELAAKTLEEKIKGAEEKFKTEQEAAIMGYISSNRSILERQAIDELKRDPNIQQRAQVALMRERPATKRAAYTVSSADELLMKIRGNK